LTRSRAASAAEAESGQAESEQPKRSRLGSASRKEPERVPAHSAGISDVVDPDSRQVAEGRKIDDQGIHPFSVADHLPCDAEHAADKHIHPGDQPNVIDTQSIELQTANTR